VGGVVRLAPGGRDRPAGCPDWPDGKAFHVRDVVTWYETFGVNNSAGNKFNATSRRLLPAVKDPDRFVFHASAVTRPSDRQEKYDDRRASPGGKIWDDVWEIPRLVGTAKERLPGFPTQLPLALLRPIIACCSDPGALVIDPFSGSGTTGAACVELGRRYLGFEQNPSSPGSPDSDSRRRPRKAPCRSPSRGGSWRRVRGANGVPLLGPS
jgi:hypothetical protein